MFQVVFFRDTETCFQLLVYFSTYRVGVLLFHAAEEGETVQATVSCFCNISSYSCEQNSSTWGSVCQAKGV